MTCEQEGELLSFAETTGRSNLDFQNNLECVWCEIVTANSEYHVATIYHPPNLHMLTWNF